MSICRHWAPLSLVVILLLPVALVSWLTCGACPGLKDAGASERSDAAWYAPTRYGDDASQRYADLVVSSRYLTMRDGVKIAIDVLLPVAELTFDLLPTSYLFRPGHSIRVALAGADTDHFILLPAEPPTLQIYRDRVHASRIDLLTIPR